MRKSIEFQLRLEGGSYSVFLTRVKNRDVPRLQQRTMYASPHQLRAQVICDALNNGMAVRILRAVEAESGTPGIT
jgi:hypothetical protein